MSATFLDHLLAAVLVIGIPIQGTLTYRGLLRAVERGDPGARLREYWLTIGLEWGLSLLTIAIWVWQRRPMAALGLSLPADWRSWAGLAITVIILAVLAAQWVAIGRLDLAGRASLRRQFGGALGLLPTDDREQRVFRLLAVTAGICEELLYRGYLIWYFARWAGTWPAVVITAVVFGVGHWYQGRAGTLKTGAVGLLAGAFYVGTGSLLWPMIAHIAVDLQGGAVGRMVASEEGTGPRGPSGADAGERVTSRGRESRAAG